MKINWAALVKQFADSGYGGSPDDFGAVIRWLKTEGHDSENVSIGGGESVALKDLYEDRPGKPFDATKAEAAAGREAEIQAEVAKQVDELKALGVGDGPRGKSLNPHRHDVKVGKNRLVDDPKGGFPHAGVFYKQVADFANEKGMGQELQNWQQATKGTLSTYGNEGTGADGGFAAPSEVRDTIMVRVTGEDSVLSRTDQLPMSRVSMSLPVDVTTPWQTTGGIQTYWEGEAGTFTQSKPALEMVEVRPRKVTCLVPVTEELLEDSTAMNSYVGRKAGEKMNFKVDESIFRGTGAGQPLGFMNSPGLITVAKETNQIADSILGINCIKMWARCYAPYRMSAVWFIQQDVETELLQLSLTGRGTGGTATAGWGTHIYLPAGNVAGSPFGSLFGRPVIPTQHCETLGDKGDIVLASMGQYLAGVRTGGIEASSSIHLWFDQDAVAFKFRMRIDGQPWHDAAIDSRDGSNTLGAFITLAAR